MNSCTASPVQRLLVPAPRRPLQPDLVLLAEGRRGKPGRGWGGVGWGGAGGGGRDRESANAKVMGRMSGSVMTGVSDDRGR